ncbi:cytochrome P450 [Amycolatopsis sp. NPDC059235]|uniref:cytochrome P450 n=1 Tax=Amycolatopsis sp. NPDC059235 TaxID=3346782 RepID=UPI0036721B8D
MSPAAPGLPPLAGPGRWRALAAAGRDRLGLMRALAAEGDAMRFRMGPKTMYFFNHPDHAKHVLRDNHANYRKGIGLVESRRALGNGLLTSDGALWKSQRRVVQPLFHGTRIAGLAGAVAEEADHLVNRWQRRDNDAPADMVSEMTRFTLSVLGRVLLDTDLRPYAGIEPAFAAVQEQAMFEMITLGSVPQWLPLPGQLRFRRAQRELGRTVTALTAEREHDRGEDLVSRLLDAADAAEDPAAARRRLRDELVTLLLAGHETTSSTLAWTWLMVGRHPEVGDRLCEEARRVLGDRRATSDDLARLTYTTAVIEEVMRLWPPVWILPRRAIAGDEIGGLAVPAGADTLICTYTLHRHPGFWRSPDRFDPDRFTGCRPERERYAYLPFGAGPRACVGSTLGMLEAVLCVATVIRRFRPTPADGYRDRAQANLSLRVRGELPMTLNEFSGGLR